jgi:hypothetical protein
MHADRCNATETIPEMKNWAFGVLRREEERIWPSRVSLIIRALDEGMY